MAAAIIDTQTEEAWLIDEEEMKVFVNSERWSLGGVLVLSSTNQG